MEGKVVSFINMKGGVGKTTLCIGIGEYLANYCNKKIPRKRDFYFRLSQTSCLYSGLQQGG